MQHGQACRGLVKGTVGAREHTMAMADVGARGAGLQWATVVSLIIYVVLLVWTLWQGARKLSLAASLFGARGATILARRTPFGLKLLFYFCAALYTTLRVASELVSASDCAALPKLRTLGTALGFLALASAQLLWDRTMRELVPRWDRTTRSMSSRRWRCSRMSAVVYAATLLIVSAAIGVCSLCTASGTGASGADVHADCATGRLRRAAEAFDLSLVVGMLLLGAALLRFSARMQLYVLDAFPLPEQHTSLKRTLKLLTRAMVVLVLCFLLRVVFLVALVARSKPLGRVCAFGGGSDSGHGNSTRVVLAHSEPQPLYYAINDWLPVYFPLLLILYFFGRANEASLLRLHAEELRKGSVPAVTVAIGQRGLGDALLQHA